MKNSVIIDIFNGKEGIWKQCNAKKSPTKRGRTVRHLRRSQRKTEPRITGAAPKIRRRA